MPAPRYGDGVIGPGPYNARSVQGMIGPANFVDDGGNLMPNTFRFLNNVFNSILLSGGAPILTVAELPADTINHKGVRGFVDDATAPTFGSVVAGGGTVAVPVYCDGINWRVG